MIAGDKRLSAVAWSGTSSPLRQRRGTANPFRKSLIHLAPWLAKLPVLKRNWYFAMVEADKLGDEKEKCLGLNFLIPGDRGVGEYFKLLTSTVRCCGNL